MTPSAETWGLWTVDGTQILAAVQQTEGEVEGLPDDRWITLEKVCVLSVQIAMMNRGPAVAPIALPYGASVDDRARIRVRMRSVSAVWWFRDMPDKARSAMQKHVADAGRAATQLAASSAGIVT